MENFLSAIQNRRSIYQIRKHSPISQDRILDLVKESVKYTPSAFHMQSARTVVLFGEQHDILWQIVLKALKDVVSPDAFRPTEERINAFAKGFGTILFLEDMDIVNEYAKKYDLYRDNFPIWAHQANGMLQFCIWNLLELNGLGASLQHYNPLIDQQVREYWNLPENWSLIAQMPFGSPDGSPEEKHFLDIEQRVLSFGASLS